MCVLRDVYCHSVTGGRVGPGPMRKLAGEGPACAPSHQLLAWGYKPVFNGHTTHA